MLGEVRRAGWPLEARSGGVGVFIAPTGPALCLCAAAWATELRRGWVSPAAGVSRVFGEAPPVRLPSVPAEAAELGLGGRMSAKAGVSRRRGAASSGWADLAAEQRTVSRLYGVPFSEIYNVKAL
ncbi:hypothetical protein ACFMQL_29330 [Nonomuraea fastidiosa]|uniref:hypothetical protein n=1 Tax=Nonomuraea fastidiosa TaxID=46173 RepID=UPI0036723812